MTFALNSMPKLLHVLLDLFLLSLDLDALNETEHSRIVYHFLGTS